MKRKLYAYVIIALIVAIGFVLLLREFIQSQRILGTLIARFFQYVLNIDEIEVIDLYHNIIRANMGIILGTAIVICFLFLCRLIISKFVSYFDEVNAGIDLLIQEDNKDITLSPEMYFMEQKLEKLKRTLKRREEDAKIAEQGKNDLVMYLAHDIKTPLTSVIGYLSLLNEATDMPIEQRAKYTNLTLDKAYRLEQLIDEFFEITRYNFQTIILEKQNINLYYMLVQLTDEFYPQLSANGKKVVLQAAEQLKLYGDPDKLARVFNNILKNAIMYSDAHSVIDIVATKTIDAITIVFTNSGVIPTEKLHTIFDKFYRMDSARSSNTGGAGLGLAIAKEIIILHGGEIFASCEKSKTNITVKLPTSSAIEVHSTSL